MGSIAGVLSGLGGEMRRENIQSEANRQKANEESALVLEHLASLARDPESAANLQQAAFKYRTLKPGQKPGKDLDLHSLMYREIQQKQQQAGQQQPQGQPAQGGDQQPAQSLPAPPQQQQQQGQPQQTDLGAAESNGPGAAPAGLPASPTQDPVQVQQQAAAAPPPVSGLSSPGFGPPPNSIATPPFIAQNSLQAPPGSFTDSQGRQQQSTSFTLPELTQMDVNKQIAVKRAEQQAELERMTATAQAQHEQERREIEYRIGSLKNSGAWDKLSPRQQAELQIGAKQITPELRPQNVPGMVPGESIAPGQQDAEGQAIDPRGQYRARIMPDGSREYTRIVPSTGRVTMPSENSKTGWSIFTVDRQGNQISEMTGAAPPSAYAPVTHNGQTYHIVDFGDHKEMIPVQSSGQTQRTVPGMTPPPGSTPTGPTAAPKPKPTSAPAAGGASGIAGSRNLGPKGLSPFQTMTAEGKLGALDNTIALATRVKANIHVLDSLLDAGKLQFLIQPDQGLIHASIARGMTLTKQERDLAADFASLMEHINVLRQPLGATGFRGHEAWGALQAQRGQLLAHPGVTEGVLNNTLTALNTQRDVIDHAVHGGTGSNAGSTGMTPPPSGKSKPKSGNENLKDLSTDELMKRLVGAH